jgi:putative membrane protein
MTDVFLAIAHHLLIFGMLAVIAMEIGLLRGSLSAQSVRQIARIDAGYGIMAILVVLAGVARVIWGAKGYEYYIHNIFFWLKMAAFIATGLASITPTVRYLRWRKALEANPAYLPPAAEIATVQLWLRLQIVLFALLPVFAALMARYSGYIEF